MENRVISVSMVNNYIKQLVENDKILISIGIKGEISNLKLHYSGHIYLTIKDENSTSDDTNNQN